MQTEKRQEYIFDFVHEGKKFSFTYPAESHEEAASLAASIKDSVALGGVIVDEDEHDDEDWM